LAAIEGTIQTRDTVEAIVSGQIEIQPFNSLDTQVMFERSFDFPKNVVAKFREAGFGTPFKPDAWLIHGDHWLFVECKHAIQTSEIRLFNKKL
jgi:hypothetical protein